MYPNTTSPLSAPAVLDLIRKTLAETSSEDGALTIKAVIHTYVFCKQAIASAVPRIEAMLAELPAAFHEQGGASFLAASVRRDGVQWGDHLQMEQLIALGLAAGLVAESFPEIMRKVLPGGMPAYRVTLPS